MSPVWLTRRPPSLKALPYPRAIRPLGTVANVLSRVPARRYSGSSEAAFPGDHAQRARGDCSAPGGWFADELQARGGGESQAGAAADASDGPGGDLPEAEVESAGRGHKVYPYLLRGVKVERPDQVWSTDITYVPMPSGFMYLAAVIDWYSRYVIAWRLSNTLDGGFCLEMLEEALRSRDAPRCSTPTRGCSSRRQAFTGRLESAGVAVSMDGRGRALDNVFVERLWRTVKYEDIYIRGYEAVPELHRGLARYFAFYNEERLHQSLGYGTPVVVYRGASARKA